jgi:hypothetical protein
MELGYYDYASLLEPRKKQGELAKQYGVDGLVFHHFWFNNEAHPGLNLHAPLVNMLKDGHPNMSFALHWCARSKWMSTWNRKFELTLPFRNMAFCKSSVSQIMIRME